MVFFGAICFLSFSLIASDSQDLQIRKNTVLNCLRTSYLHFPSGRREISFFEDSDAEFFKGQMLQYSADPGREGLLFCSVFQMGFNDFKPEKFEMILFEDSNSKQYRVAFGLMVNAVVHIDTKLPNRIKKMFEISQDASTKTIKRRLIESTPVQAQFEEKKTLAVQDQLVVFQKQDQHYADVVNSILKKSCSIM